MDKEKKEQVEKKVAEAKRTVDKAVVKTRAKVSKKVKEIKNDVAEIKEEVKEITERKQKPLVTSRILFISVLDKIYLVILGLIFLFGTYNIFAGSIASLNYGFFGRIGREILFIFLMVLLYLLFNWIYKCAVKTILCLTKNQVYKESYFPFKRSEETIPLNKITKVSTINLFWIFRAIIIHQYHHLPLIFWTWNNQEFKDKLSELITTEKEKVLNAYEDKNILDKSMYKCVEYVLGALIVIIFLIGIIKFGFFLFGSERRMAGTYNYNNNSVTLKSDGTCELKGISNNVEDCEWSYTSKTGMVNINYKYSGYYYDYLFDNSIQLKYDKQNKTLEYNGMILSK